MATSLEETSSRDAALGPADIELADTTLPFTATATKTKDQDFLVTFDPSFDVDNPKDWPSSRKWSVTDVLSATGFNRIMVSTIMAPALSTIAYELHMSSTEAVMAFSIYLLATAFGPLVIGPLSEVYGRKKVLHASNVWFLVWNIVCGFARTKEVLIASRFLAGFGASSIYALAGGVLSDVWRPEQRGRSLGIYLLIPLLGAAVGPIIGGFMAFRTTWRWMFWSTSIFQAVMIVISFQAFHETYAPTILARRAATLRKDTGDIRYYTAHECAMADRSLLSILTQALTRPLRLLLFHPVIQITAVISAVSYGILYIVLATFADLWTKQYGQSVEISGLHYIACALGEVAGSQLGGPLMDAYYRRQQSRHPDTVLAAEHRIPLSFPGFIIAAIGFLIFGWTSQFRVHWAVVDIGICVAMFGEQIAGLPLSAYTMDAYAEHASSALAASQFLRSLSAFLFPLFAHAMYEKMEYGWGNTMVAGLTLVTGAMPVVLWVWGKDFRGRARGTV
ncbi:MFS general substrate transporter [Clathrospora elynae]|uniref:MFS general substrate transporter n=1 Tax=Clathrospora elynae TaxID=706981 RepID=A0A6A5SWM5_9PLEO|nr:MFS general substrate transporter [Clathrospora elynae]